MYLYGISVGIPSYNLKEAIHLTINLLNDPNYKDCVLIPDSPTGCSIIDDGDFKNICETGKGKFKMRGVIDVDDDTNCLIIKNVPFQVSFNDIKQDIIELNDTKKIFGIVSFKDVSNEDNICFKIYLKREINPYEVIDIIYKKTQMEKTFSVQFKLIDDYQDMNFTLKSLILEWIDYRRGHKRRIFNQMLSDMKNREHILEILLFILNKNNGEKTIKLIKESNNKKEIIVRLMKEYKITSLQADIIAEMRMSSFTKEAYARYKDEISEIRLKIEKIEKIIRKPKRIDAVIIDELKECIQLFGEDRKSIVVPSEELSSIKNTDHLMVFTYRGFVKKLSHDIEKIGFINNNDSPLHVVKINNLADLLIFDSVGKVSKLPIHVVQNHTLEAEGDRLKKYCDIHGEIVSIIPKPTVESIDKTSGMLIYFLFVTKKGIVKKTNINKYVNIRSGLSSIVLKEDDALISTMILINDRDIMLYTKKGYGIRLSSKDIRETNRMSYGVSAINLDEDDSVIDVDTMNGKDKYIFMLTDNGLCKKCRLDLFTLMDKKSKPLKLMNLENESLVKCKLVNGDEKYKIYTKNGIFNLDVNDIPVLSRLSKGKKMLGLGKGNYIIEVLEDKNREGV